MKTSLNALIGGIGFLLVALLAPAPSRAEVAVGSNIDSRVVIGFKASDAAVQAMLPAGTRLLTLPRGPLAGTNLLIAFIDRHLAMDPDGAPLESYSGRSVALLAYGVSADFEGARLFVTRVYETPPVTSSYGNGQAAAIARDAAVQGAAEGPPSRTESWTVSPEDGGEITLALSYRTGRPGWSSAEAMPYSAARPEFHRIYRYRQLADLAMSTALGKELQGSVSFAADVDDLGALFDGTEQMTAILSIPVYVREVSLP